MSNPEIFVHGVQSLSDPVPQHQENVPVGRNLLKPNLCHPVLNKKSFQKKKTPCHRCVCMLKVARNNIIVHFQLAPLDCFRLVDKSRAFFTHFLQTVPFFR